MLHYVLQTTKLGNLGPLRTYTFAYILDLLLTTGSLGGAPIVFLVIKTSTWGPREIRQAQQVRLGEGG
jgi:hypothetical protein